MNRTTLGRAAIVSLALGTATIGCMPSAQTDHVASASDGAAKPDAARFAAKARRALDRRDDAAAIRWAERAASASPADADQRMLLGQAYLGAGRFASAAASFRDALTLAPDQPRAGFDLALAQIALGLSQDARVTLAGVKGRVPDADLGLALALAGDRQAGIAMLTGVVRDGTSDARVRQNLALALALDGKWDQARGMAMQDTAPDRLEAKLAGWRTMASDGEGAGARQVAAMLGTVPAIGDPGRPTRLALAVPASEARTALATAQPVPAPAMIAAASPVRTIDLPVTPPAAQTAEVAPAMPPVAMPVLLAAAPATATPVSAPRLLRTAAVAPSPAGPHAPVAPGPILRPIEQGGFVVQLGAYARAGGIETAWASASRLSPRIATLSPVKGSTLHLGTTLVRLSIGGFASRDAARALCGQIKTRGGACFVRAATGDRPWQWAKTQTGTQLAMR